MQNDVYNPADAGEPDPRLPPGDDAAEFWEQQEQNQKEREDDEDLDAITDAHESSLPSQALAPIYRNRGDSVELGEDTEGTPEYYHAKDGITRTEPQRSLRAFDRYVLQGTNRSIRKLAKELVASEDPDWNTIKEDSAYYALYNYSSRFMWQSRLRRMIASQSAKAVGQAKKGAARYKKRRIEYSNRMMEYAMSVFDRVFENVDPKSLTPDQARALIPAATKMMDIGLHTNRIEITEAMNDLAFDKPFSAMDDDELGAAVEQLRSTLGAGE